MQEKRCEIQWINSKGRPTPDDSPAIGEVWREACTTLDGFGRKIALPQTLRYAICAEHAKRLDEPGMLHWRFEPFPETEKEKS